MNILAHALNQIRTGKSLAEQEMQDVMTLFMNGTAIESEIAEFLTLLTQRGETAGEITGAARALRHKAQTIKAPDGAVDCCGTGGDGANTYNISTAVALVTAACGVPVAKHGNRAASSKSGAADVLEHMGVNLNIPHERLEAALEQIGFAFMMAPYHHAAMKHVAPVRKSLKFRTIFNLLGPLANPAGTKIQLIGVYDRKFLRPVAEALANLGTDRAMVVHGSDGLDEITLTGETFYTLLRQGTVRDGVLTPEDFGLPFIKSEDIRGGDAAYNAAALRALLGGEKSAYRDVVLANSAAVLMLHGTAKDLKEGVNRAITAIDSGKATRVLEDYIRFVE